MPLRQRKRFLIIDRFCTVPYSRGRGAQTESRIPRSDYLMMNGACSGRSPPPRCC